MAAARPFAGSANKKNVAIPHDVTTNAVVLVSLSNGLFPLVSSASLLISYLPCTRYGLSTCF